MVLREVGKGRGGENSESEALKVNDEKTQSERDIMEKEFGALKRVLN